MLCISEIFSCPLSSSCRALAAVNSSRWWACLLAVISACGPRKSQISFILRSGVCMSIISVFKLNEVLVKLRYVNLAKNNSDFSKIKTLFQRFNKKDKEELFDMAIQFNSYSLNDSVWVKVRQVYNKIGPLTPGTNEGLLKKGNFLQLEDSLGVYLVSVEDVKLRGEQAPLDYSLPTVKQILLNKRKLELIKKLEKDITQDAVRNDQFEIYNE